MGGAYPRAIPAGLRAWIRVDSPYHDQEVDFVP